MTQKKQSRECKIKEIKKHTRKKYSAEEILGLLLKDEEEKIVFRAYVAVKTLMPISVTNGARISCRLAKVV